MDYYHVNDSPQLTGEHEVHKESCVWVPDMSGRTYLGYFDHCVPALEAAREIYPVVDGCFWCCRDCHTR